MITLKEHNVKPYGELCAMLATEQKCAYVAATGTGKSYVVGKYIEDRGAADKTLILVPSNAIRDGWRLLLPTANIKNYQWLCSGTDKTLSDYEFVVCDEMHHLGAKRWGKIYKTAITGFSGKIIGITATPIRFLDKSRNMIDECFNGVAVDGLDLPTAIAKGVLPSFEYITALYNLPARMPDKSKRTEITEHLFRQLDFMKSTLSFKNILKKHLDENPHKVAVFVNSIDQIDEIKRMCMEVYPSASHYVVHSNLKSTVAARKEMEKFSADSGLAFIYTIDMLNEGVHINGVDCVIMFRKTESPTVYLQQIGRALASDMAGKRVKIFDFVANHKNLKSVTGGSGSVIRWIQDTIDNPEKQVVVSDYALEELELLERLNGVIRGAWTEEDDRIICENYSRKNGIKIIQDLLPGRSYAAITGRAVKLGVATAKGEYSEQFYADLRTYYEQENGMAVLIEKYPQYSAELIRAKATDMGLHRPQYRVVWTEAEDRLVYETSDRKATELQDIIPNHSPGEIRRRRAQLGLSKSKPVWTEEMDQILLDNPDMHWKELQQKYFPDFTERQINNRRHKKLGIPGRNDFWTDERKQRMAEAYEKGGSVEVKKLPEFRHIRLATIQTYAARLGLKNGNSLNLWTEEELKVLENYLAVPEDERMSREELMKKLPGRNWNGTKQKMRQLINKKKK